MSGALVLPAEDVDREFEFASNLIDLELPDYAEIIVARVLLKHPDLEERANVIRAQIFIALRRFNQAEEVVSTMDPTSPKAWAIKLRLADGYYQVGKEEECQGLYHAFFAQYKDKIPSDPDLLRSYQTAAHKFGQILARQEQPREAANTYELLLKTLDNKDMARQIKLEQAELLVKAAGTEKGTERASSLKKASANCAEVLWGGTDLWFGRAITCTAEIKLMSNKKEEAVRLLRENLPMLKKLDEYLKEKDIAISESPFAGARWLLGTFYYDEAALLLGAPDKRENEALRYFERAFAELDSVWRMIASANKREQVLMEKKTKGASALTGTASQRQKPFEDIAQAVKDFDTTVTDAPGDGGWTSAVAKRVKALRDRIAKLGEAIAAHPKTLGVTPVPEMELGESFKGKEDVESALSFLADEESRRQKAVSLFVRALRQFYNVFAGYPGSDWHSGAGEKVEILKDKLKGLTGKDVIIEAKEGGQRKIALVTLNEGHSLFSRKEYGKAIEAYLTGLPEYPEGNESLIALANLVECYAMQQDVIRVKMATRYIAERFAGRAEAPMIILRTARLFFEKKEGEMYRYLYELYLSRFPKHQAAPTILYMLGEQRWRVEDYGGATPYYQRIAENYLKSDYYLKALDRIGWGFYLRKDYGKAVEFFGRLAAEASHGLEKARGKLCLADSARLMESYGKAILHYRELTKWLIDKDLVYNVNSFEQKKYRDIMEQAVFFQAYCLSKISKPEDRVPKFREAAAGLYRNFVERFSSSKLAPTALSSLGAVLIATGKSEEAAKVYEELAAKYPESDAGQNARFAMLRSLADIGHMEKAGSVLDDMIRDAASYPPEHFLRAAQMMLDKEEYKSSVRAFAQVLKAVEKLPAKSKERAAMEQRALLGLGKANYASKNFEATIKSISDLVTRYPTSGLFFEARFLVARAYKESGKLDEAVEILKDVFKRGGDQSLINHATVELADIQLAKGDADGALASYQRIVLLADPEDPKTRPMYERALVGSIRILVDKEQWQDVIENCDLYINSFPSGGSTGDVRGWRAKAVMGKSRGAGEAAE